MKCKILLLGCFSGAWEWISWTTAWDRPGDDTACQVEYEPVVSSYCKEEKPRGVQSWETQCWWDCRSNTVSYFKPPRLKRNLRTCKESPKWRGTLRMMFEKQVMELGLFNLMKRQPRDNLIATEAEGTLKKQQKQTLLSIDRAQNKRQQPQVMAWEVTLDIRKNICKVVWCRTQRGDNLCSQGLHNSADKATASEWVLFINLL